MKTYTDEQIAQIFGHKTSGVQKYLEAAEEEKKKIGKQNFGNK